MENDIIESKDSKDTASAALQISVEAKEAAIKSAQLAVEKSKKIDPESDLEIYSILYGGGTNKRFIDTTYPNIHNRFPFVIDGKKFLIVTAVVDSNSLSRYLGLVVFNEDGDSNWRVVSSAPTLFGIANRTQIVPKVGLRLMPKIDQFERFSVLSNDSASANVGTINILSLNLENNTIQSGQRFSVQSEAPIAVSQFLFNGDPSLIIGYSRDDFLFKDIYQMKSGNPICSIRRTISNGELRDDCAFRGIKIDI